MDNGQDDIVAIHGIKDRWVECRYGYVIQYVDGKLKRCALLLFQLNYSKC